MIKIKLSQKSKPIFLEQEVYITLARSILQDVLENDNTTIFDLMSRVIKQHEKDFGKDFHWYVLLVKNDLIRKGLLEVAFHKHHIQTMKISPDGHSFLKEHVV